MHAYVELSKCKMCTQKPLSVKMRKVQLLVHINQRIALRMSFDAAQQKKKQTKKIQPNIQVQDQFRGKHEVA